MAKVKPLKVTLNYSTISKFGFYSSRKGVTQISDQVDILSSLQSWFKNTNKLVNTCPITRKPANGQYGVFINDMIKTPHGDFIIVLWNEVPNTGGNVMGMPEAAQPGNVAVKEANFGASGFIPGYPSYYWFIPSENAVLQVVIKGLAPGRSNLKTFLEGFLNYKSKYRVLHPNNPQKVIGFSVNGKPEDDAPLREPHFITHRVGKKNPLNDILAHQHEITRVIRQEELSSHNQRHKGQIEQFFSRILKPKGITHVDKRLVTQSLEYRPTPAEIREMHRVFIGRPDGDPLRNIGFKLTGNRTIYFDHEYEEVETEIAFNKTKNQIISAAELEAELIKRRKDLIKPLK